ncbi:MAG: DNA topoisomerase (ATP-hydrolyzing) [Microthrixaceae bacterium]
MGTMPRQEELFDDYARDIIEIPVAEEMEQSYLAYSLSVITSRAIPDVRDGLKPVQRRILHSMNNNGLRPDRPHRKCAGVVGDTMGKYHPHGDTSIYDALTKMGQDFSRNVTLIDPHGNFGSLDDPPAAHRYTECRLTPAAMAMLGEIDEDTVDMRATFDGENEEPLCLPATLPNLLVNGTSGIAVGMATNMPGHNLGEVLEAIRLVMTKRRPKPTVEELMAVLPGPDFPSGGVIIDDSIAEAYATGRGSFRIRAKVEIVNLTRARKGIVVTELPYLVGPERVVAKVRELMRAEKAPMVSDIKDLSDRRTGLRLEIELRPGANAAAVLTDLFRQTPLEETFGVNNVVLVDGQPTTVGLYDLCNYYVEHRLDVVRRRTAYRLEKARRRLHLLEGLLIALDAIDLVVSIIRSSHDVAEARARLIEELNLSDVQAVHILDMQLRRLTALAKLELQAEADELRKDIDDYEKILGSEQRQRTIVLKELESLVEQFVTPRRSVIVSPDQIDDVTMEDVAAEVAANSVDEPCVVAVSHSGMIGREPIEGPKPATFARHDVLLQRVATTTHASIWAVTSRGRCFPCRVSDIGEVTGRSRGSALSELFALDKGESVRTLVSAPPPGAEVPPPLMLVTGTGVMKRLDIAEVVSTPAGKHIIKLKPGDTVVAAFAAPDGHDIAAVASNAQVMRCEAASVSVQGRNAGGVTGMKLSDGATVVGAGAIIGDSVILTVTDAQTAKVTDASEVPTKGRATSGVRITKFRNEKKLEWAWVGAEDGVLLVVGTEDAPSKPDPAPQPLTIQHTGRDLISKSTRRRLLAIGFGRW